MMTDAYAEFDKELTRRSAIRQASFEAQQIGQNRSESSLREKYRQALRARDEQQAMQSCIQNSQRKIDELVEQHAAVTAPLQAELADDATTPARRIECRVLINSANEQLQNDLLPLNKNIEAAQQELELLAAKTSGISSIENSFVEAGPEHERLRLKTLRAVDDALSKHVIFRAKKAADEAAHFAKVAKDDREHWLSATADSLRAKAELAGAILSELQDIRSRLIDEIDSIRESRLAELRR
jgi:hypothetical protein